MISDSVSSTYCDARTSNCVRSKFATVTTEIIAVSTTVCPVSDKTIPADVPSYTMTEIESTIEMSFSRLVCLSSLFPTLPRAFLSKAL